jgi:hypothetical protein
MEDKLGELIPYRYSLMERIPPHDEFNMNSRKSTVVKFNEFPLRTETNTRL